jgi:hypothetical protein
MTTPPAPLLDTWFVTIRAPWSLDLTFWGLEIVVVTCGVLSLLHALRARRQGDGVALLTWCVSFTYGILMEVGSYNFVKAFAHGQFPVMFYRSQLPLYVVFLYPVLQYTSIVTARRLCESRIAILFTAGLLIVAMDFPFDILGPVEGWWSWSDTDPNMAFRWHGVPVTSYYWHLAWGGILGTLTTVVGGFGGDPNKPWRAVFLALSLALLTIVLGVLSFAPFHLLKALGVPDGTIVAGLFVTSFVVAHRARSAVVAPPRDARLFTIPALYYSFFLVVALRDTATIGTAFGGKMVVIASVIAVAVVVHARTHLAVGSRPLVARSDP